ncbi:MAG: DUF2752 domain-containing protein [Oscillibacter sp.]|nr:DUF2752 domain-containing protein [Oscillibacter sp.]
MYRLAVGHFLLHLRGDGLHLRCQWRGEGSSSAGTDPVAEVKEKGPRAARPFCCLQGGNFMQRGSMTDREAYPTAWITLAVLVLLYLLWRFALGAPTVSRCWVWEHWHVYCPGCGGTRALMALAQGRVGAALWYHTPVVITLALAAIYLFSQTAWRLRGKRGWVLRYDRRWPMVLVGLFLANCVVRNVLWLGLGVPL